jgi:DNA-binding transcriptional MerR regulator
MRINEVEALLGVPKATIRFYEKMGLITPERKSNQYREYSQEDVLQLQNIVILRKLGLSVQDIEKLQRDEITLQDAIQANITQLEEQLRQLEGSLRLSKLVAAEGADQLDTTRYWQLIRAEESAGGSFVEVVDDFWKSVMIPTLRLRFFIPKGESLRKALPWLLAGNTLFALSKTFLWKDGNFFVNFLYWPGIILAVALLTFPMFFLEKRNHPKLAGFLWKLLLGVCLGVLGIVLLLIIGGPLVGLWNSIFGS